MNPTTLLSRAVAGLRGVDDRAAAAGAAAATERSTRAATGERPLTDEEALALATALEAELRGIDAPPADLRGLPLTQSPKGSAPGTDN